MVEQGRLVGVISIGDVVKHRVEEIERETERAARIHRDGVVRVAHVIGSNRSRPTRALRQRGDHLVEAFERALGRFGAERDRFLRRDGNRTGRCVRRAARSARRADRRRAARA